MFCLLFVVVVARLLSRLLYTTRLSLLERFFWYDGENFLINFNKYLSLFNWNYFLFFGVYSAWKISPLSL